MRLLSRLLLTSLGTVLVATSVVFAESDFLTPEENLWLKARNNTIVVYPEQNGAPFSYQTPGGSIQGLSVDYIELISEKIGAKIQYLTPRSRSQVLNDIANGKGDIALSLTPSADREAYLVFTESYVTVPVVIVVRKDIENRKTLTMTDFSGKRVAMIEGSAIQEYIRKNYPRVVIESVTDDEVGLQKIVLGETEAAVMDVASLSYLLSKQVLNSVKVVGNTGYDYHISFAVSKGKGLLQSILEKGLSQISTTERQLLTDKWIALPKDDDGGSASVFERVQTSSGVLILYFLFGIGFIGMLILITHNKKHLSLHRYFRKKEQIDELQGEIDQLEDANKTLVRELDEVKHLETEIKEKLDNLKS